MVSLQFPDLSQFSVPKPSIGGQAGSPEEEPHSTIAITYHKYSPNLSQRALWLLSRVAVPWESGIYTFQEQLDTPRGHKAPS